MKFSRDWKPQFAYLISKLSLKISRKPLPMSKPRKSQASLMMLPSLLEMLKKSQLIAKSWPLNHHSSLKLYQPELMLLNVPLMLPMLSQFSLNSSLKMPLYISILLTKLTTLSKPSLKSWVSWALNADYQWLKKWWNKTSQNHASTILKISSRKEKISYHSTVLKMVSTFSKLWLQSAKPWPLLNRLKSPAHSSNKLLPWPTLPPPPDLSLIIIELVYVMYKF